ncbi:hypothetical protein, unlikely [Trypanosoma brucei gambiense DAL972]|uniref:T. brucei spp.-specific protein n=1 Tax=Trypanosoma brucei gambiense (strain MHOM/CI/86/DAL972) TaxID=679716 RepID=C9ZP37_TRYB9|nr:hypothetical protein, unlikely [Trypanosoma brucei gambiense DAL972]CBH11165.1 hypothetical protein, unlikely [Trypanosoma brucei gambiense DAL972]|eukprot:XP_011773452.1 hypothetical protein, unlikely [Trypanosoma brucei gambiense DAL972]
MLVFSSLFLAFSQAYFVLSGTLFSLPVKPQLIEHSVCSRGALVGKEVKERKGLEKRLITKNEKKTTEASLVLFLFVSRTEQGNTERKTPLFSLVWFFLSSAFFFSYQKFSSIFFLFNLRSGLATGRNKRRGTGASQQRSINQGRRKNRKEEGSEEEDPHWHFSVLVFF